MHSSMGFDTRACRCAEWCMWVCMGVCASGCACVCRSLSVCVPIKYVRSLGVSADLPVYILVFFWECTTIFKYFTQLNPFHKPFSLIMDHELVFFRGNAVSAKRISVMGALRRKPQQTLSFGDEAYGTKPIDYWVTLLCIPYTEMFDNWSTTYHYTTHMKSNSSNHLQAPKNKLREDTHTQTDRHTDRQTLTHRQTHRHTCKERQTQAQKQSVWANEHVVGGGSHWGWCCDWLWRESVNVS